MIKYIKCFFKWKFISICYYTFPWENMDFLLKICRILFSFYPFDLEQCVRPSSRSAVCLTRDWSMYSLIDGRRCSLAGSRINEVNGAAPVTADCCRPIRALCDGRLRVWGAARPIRLKNHVSSSSDLNPGHLSLFISFHLPETPVKKTCPARLRPAWMFASRTARRIQAGNCSSFLLLSDRNSWIPPQSGSFMDSRIS